MASARPHRPGSSPAPRPASQPAPRSASGTVSRALSRPPARLPRGYHAIWEALRQANEEAVSRQALARRLGVSTHTIQRILVEGDVPRFPQERNPRITRSWARTLTRMAHELGHDAGKWIRAVGLPEAEATVATGGRAAAVRSSDRTARTAVTPALAPVPAELRVSLATPGLLDGSLALLWLGAVDPGRTVVAEPSLTDRPQEKIESDGPFHFGLGTWPRPRALGRDPEWIRVPGWRVSLAAMQIASEGSPAPNWNDIMARPAAATARFVVPEDHPARDFLLGAVRVDPQQLSAPPASPPALDAGVVLVADELTCRHWHDRWTTATGDHGGRAAWRLADPEGTAPAYPIGLHVSPLLRAWVPPLREALEHALFGSLSAQTAEIYAATLAREVRSAVLRDPFATAIERGPIWLEEFPEAGDRFIEHFSRRLLDRLADAIREHLGTLEQRQWARVLASRHGAAILPTRWRPFLSAALNGRRPEENPHCRSCSASLLDPVHRGVSDDYCRFCSDDQGHLRERDAVHRLLAQWFAHWPGGVPEPEAARRATSFMAAMPAWQRN